jgi:hypothetical protein
VLKRFVRIATYLIVLIGFSVARSDTYVDFFRAVDRDDARAVVSLLQRGFDVNAPHPASGQPALTLAIQIGSPQVAAVLIEHPQLRLDATNPSGETALMMAALRGDIASLQRLIDRGARLESAGWTALQYAAAGPDERATRLLLQRADVRGTIDGIGPNGLSALMMAARHGSGETVDLLLAGGADPALRSREGARAEDFARASGREWLVERLQRARR